MPSGSRSCSKADQTLGYCTNQACGSAFRSYFPGSACFLTALMTGMNNCTPHIRHCITRYNSKITGF